MRPVRARRGARAAALTTAAVTHCGDREIGEDRRRRCRARPRAGSAGERKKRHRAGEDERPRPGRRCGAERRPTRRLYWRSSDGPQFVWRRVATAVGIYGSALLGILATVVAARELTKLDFSRFALVFAVTGSLQLFLDLTVEEVVVKFGNRYIARGDWPRFHRLLAARARGQARGRRAGSLAIVLTAARSPWIWAVGGDTRGAARRRAAAVRAGARRASATRSCCCATATTCVAACSALLDGAQAGRGGVGASIGLVRRLSRSSSHNVISTATISAVGLLRSAAFREPRRSRSARTAGGSRVRGAVQRRLGPYVVARPTADRSLGIVAPTDRGRALSDRAGATDRVRNALGSRARLVLLAEQTRDVERGRGDLALALLRRYVGGATCSAGRDVPLLWLAVPTLVRWIYGAR